MLKLTSRWTKFYRGREGKSKGLLHVLWERGLFDPQLLDKYTLEGKKIQYQGSVTYSICYVTSLPNALISRMKKLHYSIWDHSRSPCWMVFAKNTQVHVSCCDVQVIECVHTLFYCRNRQLPTTMTLQCSTTVGFYRPTQGF